MENRVLVYFIAVAEAGSISAASARCHVTQPSMSRQISALERELDVKLFRRTSAGLQLSSAGQLFLPIAVDIIGRVQRASALMHSLAASESLALTAVCPPATVTSIVAPFVASTGAPITDIRDAYPPDVYEMLSDPSIDVAISTSAPPGNHRAVHLGKVPLAAQFVEGCIDADVQTIDIARLASETIVVPSYGTATRRVLDQGLQDAGVVPRTLLETKSGAMAQALAASRRGWAIVTEPPLFGLDGRVLTSDGDALAIDFYAAWDNGHYASEQIMAITRSLSEWIGAHMANPMDGLASMTQAPEPQG
jgi:DNA-binding transcriptional LysR family regulator